ncbi:MAG: DUF559 domain-containing protein [Candidatus Brocadia sp.]|nr:DUF559 domain-containing protein [Candidatus Brocadia sp.]
MSSKEWKTYPLGEITSWKSGGTPSKNKEDYWHGNIPWISARTFTNIKICDSSIKITKAGLDNGSRMATIDSILLLVRGSGLFNNIPIGIVTKPVAFNQDIKALEVDRSRVLPRFLMYWLIGNKALLMSKLEETGIGAGKFDIDILRGLKVKTPTLELQKRIVDFIQCLDDKIELNRQTNQTLEAIAQAIYKEWFVDFRFPHSPLEGCPKGGVDTSPLEGWQAKPDGVDSLQTTHSSLASWQKNSLFPFWTLPKNRTLQERAKELRKQGILSEVVFWKTFKDKKKLGWDIDRQVIIGNFIVDFFIPELGLVFEIDGSSHNDKQEYDQKRDAFLSSLQLKVVRIPGKDVLGNIEGVWRFVTRLIKGRVEELSPPRPSGTPQEGKKCEMQDSELGPIPKGWRVVAFEEELEAERGLSYKGEGLATSGAVPMHNLNSVYEGGGYKFEGIKYYSGEHKEKHIVQPGDLIIANTEQGHKYLLIGYPAIVPYVFGEIGIYSHHIYRLRPRPHSYLTSDFLYQLLLRPEIREQVVSFANGTTVNMLKIEGLQKPKFVLPPRYLVSKFFDLAASIRLRQEENIKQSTTLSAIRDALLPKLMSGEIAV